MKKMIFLGAFVLAFSLLTVTGNAADVFTDDFEGYADDAALQASDWSDIPGRSGILLGTDGGASGSNYLQLPAALARIERGFGDQTPTDADPYIWSFNMRCRSAVQDNDYNEIIKWEAGIPKYVVRMGDGNTVASDNFTANIWVGDGAGGTSFDSGWFVLGGPDEARGVNEWHKLSAVLKSTTIDFYVDDKFCTTQAIPAGHHFDLMYVGAEVDNDEPHDVDDASFEKYVAPTPTFTVVPTDTPTPVDTPTLSSDVTGYEVYE